MKNRAIFDILQRTKERIKKSNTTVVEARREIAKLAIRLDILGYHKYADKIDKYLQSFAQHGQDMATEITRVLNTMGLQNEQFKRDLLDRILKSSGNKDDVISRLNDAEVLLKKLDISYSPEMGSKISATDWMQWLNEVLESIDEGEGGEEEISQIDDIEVELSPEGKIIKIPEWLLPKLKSKIESLARIAKKLSLPPPVLNVLEEEVRWDTNGKGTKWFTVEIEGEAPALKGWEFVARIEHHDTGNVIFSISDDPILKKYRFADNTCEHCGYKRERINTYLLKNTETGEYKQVGSMCLKDFIGHGSAEKLARYFDSLASLTEDEISTMLKNTGTKGHRVHYYIDPLIYLANVSAIINKFGWTPKSASNEHREPTAYLAIENMSPTTRRKPITVTPRDHALAQNALDWIRNLDPDQFQGNNYLYNLWAVANLNAINFKHLGLMASLIPTYLRETGQITPKKEVNKEIVKEYIGRPGERREFTLTVNKIVPIETAYGTTHLHVMHDQDGHEIIWWGTYPLEESNTYRMRATVKEHRDYKGTPQTVITRPANVTKV